MLLKRAKVFNSNFIDIHPDRLATRTESGSKQAVTASKEFYALKENRFIKTGKYPPV
jgi:hypothetical protein